MNFAARAKELEPWIIGNRHWLHQHAELSLKEVETTAFLVRNLEEIGIPVQSYDDYYGCIATIKGTAGVLYFTEEEDRMVENPQCIRCGKCITVCPMNLEPVFMYMYYSKGDYENM